MNPTRKANLEIAATTFLGGVVMFVTTHFGADAPSSAAQWESFAGGAFTAGVAALYHRYQTAPADLAVLKAAAAKVAGPALILLGLGGLGVTQSGCASWFQSHPAVVSDLQKTEECVEGELVKDEAAGDTPLTIGIDLGVTCGADAAAVVEAALAQVAPTASAKSKAHVLLAAKPIRISG